MSDISRQRNALIVLEINSVYKVSARSNAPWPVLLSPVLSFLFSRVEIAHCGKIAHHMLSSNTSFCAEKEKKVSWAATQSPVQLTTKAYVLLISIYMLFKTESASPAP